MACVTLKRSLDFDPLHSPNRSTKRRRCCATTTSSSSSLHSRSSSSLQDQRAHSSSNSSVFRESTLTPEQIANNLRDEIKRLKKRKQIPSKSLEIEGFRQWCGGFIHCSTYVTVPYIIFGAGSWNLSYYRSEPLYNTGTTFFIDLLFLDFLFIGKKI